MHIWISKLLPILLVPLVLLCSLILSPFLFSYSPDKVMVATMSCYAVPYGYESDPHQFRSKIIEEDAYGRVLFSLVPGGHVLCISQKTTDTHVYYYDNICYGHIEHFLEYEQEQDTIQKLKELNDWDRPLDESRMVRRPLNDKSLFPSLKVGELRHYENSCSIFEEQVALPAGYGYGRKICDRSDTGQELYCFRVYETGEAVSETWDEAKNYFMVLNADGSYDPDTFLLGFAVWEESNGPLAEIKMQNGWYGDA